MPLSASFHLTKTVVLVGLMGAGKTTIGRRLAERLSVPFVDIDMAIEQQVGKTVAQIFALLGEEEFRRFEKRTIARDLESLPHVMATGGGAFMDADTRALIKRGAVSVWLRADLGTLIDRVSRKHTRPLLEEGNKGEIMRGLMVARYPIYAEADIVVDTDQGPHARVVDDIVERLKAYKAYDA